MDFNDDDDGTIVEAGSITSMMDELASYNSLEEHSNSSSSDDDSVDSIINVPPTIVEAPLPSPPSTPPTQVAITQQSATPISSNKKEKKKGSYNSIAHDNFLEGNLVLFHVDLETGGKNCGIIQLATIAYDVDKKRALDDGFNKYINPGSRYWDDNCIAIHGIQPNDKRITGADGIAKVWWEWKAYIESHLTGGKVGCIEAWGCERTETENQSNNARKKTIAESNKTSQCYSRLQQQIRR